MAFSVEKSKMSNFLNKEIIYEVPGYQRHYAWKNVQQTQFLDDFEKQVTIGHESDYYLGQILTSGEGHREAIVDGQQRIITTIIVLRVVIDLLNTYKKKLKQDKLEVLSKRIESQISRYNRCLYVTKESEPERKIITGDNSIILNSITDGTYSESLISNKSSHQDKVLSESYISISKDIKSRTLKRRALKDRAEYIMDLMHSILSSQLVIIHDSNQDTGFKIFKDINSKGIPLTQLDLLKSSIFEEQNNKSATAMQQIEAHWKNLESLAYEKLNMDFFDFIVLSWSVLYPKTITEIDSGASLYDLYNELTDTDDNLSTTLIDNFIEVGIDAENIISSNVYKSNAAYTQFNNENSAIKNLLLQNDYKSFQKMEFIFIGLAFKSKHSSENNAKKYSRALRESSSLFLLLSTLLLVFKLNADENERRIYIEIQKLIKECHTVLLNSEPNELTGNIKLLHEKLQDIFSQDDLDVAFKKVTFDKKNSPQWDGVGKSIMYQLANNYNSFSTNGQDYSIEHIIDKEFKSEPNRYMLGNLLVLNKNYNAECNDMKSSFEQNQLSIYLEKKFQIYKKSNYTSVQMFLEDNNFIDFNSKKITDRTYEISYNYYHSLILKDK